MTIEPLLDAFDLLVAHAAEVVDESEITGPARLARDGRRRIGHLGEGLVVALAGGTGSGKSSLLNAIAGTTVTASGPIRPTTSTAVAWAPRTPEPGIVRLLEDMGITDVFFHDESTQLTILDMPDTDSVISAHRAVFQDLLPRVDAVVWVVDPEKYNDRLLHHDYLAPLSDYADQFLFVINQIDRLSPVELDAVIADFADRLRLDGIRDALIVPTAADPTDGDVRGVANLMKELDARLDAKRIVVEKVAIDARRSAEALATAAGIDGRSLDFDNRWDLVRERAVGVLGDLVGGAEVEEVAMRSGRVAALRKAVGPLGALGGAIKDSALGRLLGFRDPSVALETATGHWNRRAGLEAVYSLIERFVGDVANDLGGRHAVKLREALPPSRTTQGVQAVVDRALLERPFPDVVASVPGWLRVFGVLKWLLAGTFLAGAIWLWAVPLKRGDWPWPVIMMVGAVVAGLLATRVAEGIGSRGGRYRTRQFRSAITEHLGNGLNREFGAVIRSHVSDKALLAAEVDEVTTLAAATLTEMERVGA